MILKYFYNINYTFELVNSVSCFCSVWVRPTASWILWISPLAILVEPWSSWSSSSSLNCKEAEISSWRFLKLEFFYLPDLGPGGYVLSVCLIIHVILNFGTFQDMKVQLGMTLNYIFIQRKEDNFLRKLWTW